MRLRALLLSVLLAGVPGLAAATTPVVTAIRSVPQDHAAAPFTAGGRVARAPDGVGVLHHRDGLAERGAPIGGRDRVGPDAVERRVLG